MPKVTAQLQAESFSHAAGQNATASFANSYCWSDSSTFATTAANQFIVKATGTTGGVRERVSYLITAQQAFLKSQALYQQPALKQPGLNVNTNPANQWAGSPPTTLADALYRLTNTINALYGLPIP